MAAWQMIRNSAEAKVNWRFTTEYARIKLKKLYPSIETQQSTSPIYEMAYNIIAVNTVC